MDKDNYSSRLFNNAVLEFAKFPGIGKKTAIRLVIYLLKQDKINIEHFGNTIMYH